MRRYSCLSLFPSYRLSLFLLVRRTGGEEKVETCPTFSGLEAWPLPWMKVNLRKWRPDLCIMTSPAITQTINILCPSFFSSKYKSDKFMCPSRSKAERITFYESSSSRSHRDYYSRETNLNFWRDYASLPVFKTPLSILYMLHRNCGRKCFS